MLTVHHLGISQSERIVWLCEELEIPYHLVIHDRDPVTMLAPPSYKALHPMGIAPVIVDGDVVLGESAAIIDYIIAKYGDGRLALGPSDPNFANYLFWVHFANGTFMATEMIRGFLPLLGDAGDNPMVQAVVNRTDRALAMLEQRLGESDYLAGPNFSAADILNFFPLTTMRTFAPRDLTPFPNIRAYLKRVGARPAYLRAMAKGDPGLPLRLE